MSFDGGKNVVERPGHLTVVSTPLFCTPICPWCIDFAGVGVFRNHLDVNIYVAVGLWTTTS